MAEPKQWKDGNNYSAPVFRDLTTQNVAFTGTAGAIGNAIDAECTLVRVWATQDCFVKSGSSPTATTSHMPVTAKVATYMVVQGGDKVSAVRVSASGSLYVTELR